MKLSANFFKSFNLTSLSFLALIARAFSTVLRCWAANPLKAFVTSRSTVEVAFGGSPALACGDGFRLADEEAAATEGFSSFNSGKAIISLAGGLGVTVSTAFAGTGAGAGAEGAGEGLTFSTTGLSDFNCAEMMAGSTGAPLTEDDAAGALRAGGVYLLIDDDRGGKSC